MRTQSFCFSSLRSHYSLFGAVLQCARADSSRSRCCQLIHRGEKIRRCSRFVRFECAVRCLVHCNSSVQFIAAFSCCDSSSTCCLRFQLSARLLFPMFCLMMQFFLSSSLSACSRFLVNRSPQHIGAAISNRCRISACYSTTTVSSSANTSRRSTHTSGELAFQLRDNVFASSRVSI